MEEDEGKLDDATVMPIMRGKRYVLVHAETTEAVDVSGDGSDELSEAVTQIEEHAHAGEQRGVAVQAEAGVEFLERSNVSMWARRGSEEGNGQRDEENTYEEHVENGLDNDRGVRAVEGLRTGEHFDSCLESVHEILARRSKVPVPI